MFRKLLQYKYYALLSLFLPFTKNMSFPLLLERYLFQVRYKSIINITLQVHYYKVSFVPSLGSDTRVNRKLTLLFSDLKGTLPPRQQRRHLLARLLKTTCCLPCPDLPKHSGRRPRKDQSSRRQSQRTTRTRRANCFVGYSPDIRSTLNTGLCVFRIIVKCLAEGHLVSLGPSSVLPMTATHRCLHLEWCITQRDWIAIIESSRLQRLL
ncbi:hypothetical protein TNCV_2508611 [Trichonephila clavipes]|nr:hypothetical protein TNCV_2508611 [Trichonephila clavipes]